MTGQQKIDYLIESLGAIKNRVMDGATMTVGATGSAALGGVIVDDAMNDALITQSEFDRIVAEFNSAVKKPGWWYPLWPLCMLFHCFTCHGCDPHRRGGCFDFVLDKVAEQMNTQYANRGVQFTIKTRLENSLWAAIPFCGDCFESYESYFLVIQQQAGGRRC